MVKFFVPSFDGHYVVLGLTTVGIEWSELRVLRVDDRQLLPDSIYRAGWWAVSWMPDNESFSYSGSNVTDIKEPGH